jgi:hypothetical protein
MVGCVTSKPAYHAKMPHDAVYLDPHNSWANNCPVKHFPSHGICQSPWRSITLRVINKRYRDVKVNVVCSYDNAKFGERSVSVDARDDKVFTVWGLSRMVPDNERVVCKIISLR